MCRLMVLWFFTKDIIKVHFALLRAIDLNMVSGGSGLGKIFLDFKERLVRSFFCWHTCALFFCTQCLNTHFSSLLNPRVAQLSVRTSATDRKDYGSKTKSIKTKQQQNLTEQGANCSTLLQNHQWESIQSLQPLLSVMFLQSRRHSYIITSSFI